MSARDCVMRDVRGVSSNVGGGGGGGWEGGDLIVGLVSD